MVSYAASEHVSFKGNTPQPVVQIVLFSVILCILDPVKALKINILIFVFLFDFPPPMLADCDTRTQRTPLLYLMGQWEGSFKAILVQQRSTSVLQLHLAYM